MNNVSKLDEFYLKIREHKCIFTLNEKGDKIELLRLDECVSLSGTCLSGLFNFYFCFLKLF